MPDTSAVASGPPNGGLELIINSVYMSQDFGHWTASRLRQNKFTHIVHIDKAAATDLDPNEFECLELNFQAALVLPNLYKSDKFIAKALKNDGKVLILEPATTAHYQKAIAIIIGYLMYNFEMGFWQAHETLKKVYRTKFDLDRFLIMQLYEYEPILEVHRETEEMGHSRSGERLRSVLKRALDSSYEETASGNTTLDDCHNHYSIRDEVEEDEDDPGLDAQDEEEGANFYLTHTIHNNNTNNNNSSHCLDMNSQIETMVE